MMLLHIEIDVTVRGGHRMEDSDDDNDDDIVDGTNIEPSSSSSSSSSSSDAAEGAMDDKNDESMNSTIAAANNAAVSLNNPNRRHKMEWKLLRERIQALKKDKVRGVAMLLSLLFVNVLTC
jgi:hypothetical protein